MEKDKSKLSIDNVKYGFILPNGVVCEGVHEDILKFFIQTQLGQSKNGELRGWFEKQVSLGMHPMDLVVEGMGWVKIGVPTDEERRSLSMVEYNDAVEKLREGETLDGRVSALVNNKNALYKKNYTTLVCCDEIDDNKFPQIFKLSKDISSRSFSPDYVVEKVNFKNNLGFNEEMEKDIELPEKVEKSSLDSSQFLADYCETTKENFEM